MAWVSPVILRGGGGGGGVSEAGHQVETGVLGFGAGVSTETARRGERWVTVVGVERRRVVGVVVENGHLVGMGALLGGGAAMRTPTRW